MNSLIFKVRPGKIHPGKMNASNTSLGIKRLAHTRLGIFIHAIFITLICINSSTVWSVEEQQTTEAQLEVLKKEVLSVNRDLFILEEDLLFPASTQVAIYLSVDIGYFFALDNIKIKIDDKDATHFLYTKNDIDALHRGAIQKLYLGNISTGKHEIVAIVIGIGPHEREYRRAIAFEFEKSSEAAALEIQLRDDQSKQQPELKIVEW